MIGSDEMKGSIITTELYVDIIIHEKSRYRALDIIIDDINIFYLRVVIYN